MSDVWFGLILIIGVIVIVGSVGQMSTKKTGGYTAHNIKEARLAQAQSQVDKEAASGCVTWVIIIAVVIALFMVLQYSVGMAIEQCC